MTSEVKLPDTELELPPVDVPVDHVATLPSLFKAAKLSLL